MGRTPFRRRPAARPTPEYFRRRQGLHLSGGIEPTISGCGIWITTRRDPHTTRSCERAAASRLTWIRTPLPQASTTSSLARVTVGSKLTINGGGAADTVQCAGPLTVGGDMTIAQGRRHYSIRTSTRSTATIASARTSSIPAGPAKTRRISTGTTVGNNVDVNLGNWDGKNDIVNTYADGNHQFFKTGTYNEVTVYGPQGAPDRSFTI